MYKDGIREMLTLVKEGTHSQGRCWTDYKEKTNTVNKGTC